MQKADGLLSVVGGYGEIGFSRLIQAAFKFSIVFILQSGFDFIERIAKGLNCIENIITIRFEDAHHYVGGSPCKAGGGAEAGSNKCGKFLRS